MDIESCICNYVDVGVGFMRVSNEPGCPVHYPDEIERPDSESSDDALEFMRQKLQIELERRHRTEQFYQMTQARILELRQRLEERDAETYSWIVQELNVIATHAESERESRPHTPDTA